MDTSQAHLSGKTGPTKDVTKPDNLSREELTAVLKYGAQKLCVIHVPPSLMTD
jgi:chromodomain-helicase-DNA-binding protein 1